VKQRKPLQRRTPLRTKTCLQGGGRLAPKRKRQRTIKPSRRLNRAHMGQVKALGCWCCRKDGRGWVPAEAHHIREGYGASEKAHDDETIPLCVWHHREVKDGFICLHKQYRTWVAHYGPERGALAETHEDLAREASLTMAG